MSTGGLVISWEPVTLTVTGEALNVTGYEVILTKVDHDDLNGFSRPIYDVHVGPTATSLAVPDGFVEPATVYELEVLVLEASGNQTISLGFFTTSDPGRLRRCDQNRSVPVSLESAPPRETLTRRPATERRTR